MTSSPDHSHAQKRRWHRRILTLIGGLSGATLGLVTVVNTVAKDGVAIPATALGRGQALLAMILGVSAGIACLRIISCLVEKLGSRGNAVFNGAWVGAIVTSAFVTGVWAVYFTTGSFLREPAEGDHSVIEILAEVPIFGCIHGIPAGVVLGVLVGALVARDRSRSETDAV